MPRTTPATQDPDRTAAARKGTAREPLRRPTIFDLEKYCGASRSTISRAFCPGSSIKTATRDLILRSAAEIGYAPHAGARMIRSQRMFRWGLLIPHLNNPDNNLLVESLDAEARRRDTFLILGLSHFDAKLESNLIRHWASGEVDGLILNVESWKENEGVYRQLQKRNFPMIFLHYAREGYSTVVRQNGPSYRLAMEQFIALGHRRIGYVGYDFPNSRLVFAFEEYVKVLRAHGLPVDEELQYFGTHNRAGGIAAWRHFRTLAAPPTAVLAFNDILACGLWTGVHADGLEVPRDLSIVGNDDVEEAAAIGLTSIRYDRMALARCVFDTLEKLRSGELTGAQNHTLPTELILRNSIGVPRPPQQPA